MKKVVPRITLLVITFIFSLTLLAQENPTKQSSKELAEKGSRGDVITGKREQKKELKAPPLKISKPDSVKPAPKKLAKRFPRRPKT